MDLIVFFEEIEGIILEVDRIIEELDKTEYISREKISQLLLRVSKIMETWLYFIKEMRDTDEQLLMEIYEDIAKASLTEDRIRLTDALLFGLQNLLCEYYIVLKEAVNEEWNIREKLRSIEDKITGFLGKDRRNKTKNK